MAPLPALREPRGPPPVSPRRGAAAALEPMTGTLYVVATPLGNLEDVSARALRVLREVDLIACEDTRRTRGLLAHFDIHIADGRTTSTTSCAGAPSSCGGWREGQSVALVTDAGTPGISDPGFLLVREARAAGIPVVPVPGPSAVVTTAAQRRRRAGRPLRLRRVSCPSSPAGGSIACARCGSSRPRSCSTSHPTGSWPRWRPSGEVFGEVAMVVARELTKQFEEIVAGHALGSPGATRRRRRSAASSR